MERMVSMVQLVLKAQLVPQVLTERTGPTVSMAQLVPQVRMERMVSMAQPVLKAQLVLKAQ
jgi:hypothetical protein